MNGSDIETSSNRGVRIAGTSVTAPMMRQRARSQERDTFSTHVLRPIRGPDEHRRHPHARPRRHVGSDPAARAAARLEGDPRDRESAEDAPLDTVGKWLVITRAAVFPMTIWSGLIGGLLAVEANRVAGGPPVDWGLFADRRGRAGAGPRREQHDQRLLRHDERRRHGRLRPGAVRPAPDPVGLGDEAPARRSRSSWSTRSAPRSCCTSPRSAGR